ASRDTPEGQLAADPAAIDDHVRIERHRISPEMISAFCIRSVSEALSDYINCYAIRRKQGPASLLPLWEKVDRRREAAASRMRGCLRELCSWREPLIRRFAPPSPTRGEGRNKKAPVETGA